MTDQWTATDLVFPFLLFAMSNGPRALETSRLSVGLDSLLTRAAIAGSSIKSVVFRVGFSSSLRPCCGERAASLAYATVCVAV